MPEDEILALPTVKVKKVHQIGDEINQFYYGDNLPILLSFLENKYVKGKVKLIYINPPFATKSLFQSRSQSNAYSDLLRGSQYL